MATDVLLWLLTIELLGLAALPLAMFLFRGLPDRGYGLSKILGLGLIGFLNFWLGSISGLGNQPLLLWILALALSGGGAALYWRGWATLPADRRGFLLTAGIEEALFLVAFAGWALVRAHNPDIYGTEKPMDFMLMQVSGMSHHFPPPDAWLSGHTVNYYYLGYLIFATLGNLSGVDARYGFNLANVAIFALGCVGAYSLTLALVKSRVWALAGSVALMLAGDLDGLAQAIAQIGNGVFKLDGLNLFCSTRIIDSPHTVDFTQGSPIGCGNYRTITEFPIFSVIWNDLHPHVMALPFALLAVGVAFAALLDREESSDRLPATVLRLALFAIIIGALFPINSWDYPTYLLLALAALFIASHRAGTLTTSRAASIAAILPGSLIAYLPYYLTVHSYSKGIGLQASPSDIGQVLTVIGPLLIPVALYAVWQFVLAALPPLDEEAGTGRALPSWLYTAPTGWGYFAIGITILGLVALPFRTDVLLLAIVALAVYALVRRLRLDSPESLLGLGLATGGALLLLNSDYVYLQDIFAGGDSYRMNTVFKLYYQAWILLSIGAVYAVATIWRALRRARPALGIAWAVVAALLAAATMAYPIQGIASQGASQGGGSGFDGLAYLRGPAADGPEYDAILWIRNNLPADAVIAEAGGADAPPSLSNCTEYWVCSLTQAYNKVSALTARSTIVGWPNSHESLWRGGFVDPSAYALLQQRKTDVRSLYTITDLAQAQALIRQYGVGYIYVGPVERATYPAAGIAKFDRFLGRMYDKAGVIVFRVPPSAIH